MEFLLTALTAAGISLATPGSFSNYVLCRPNTLGVYSLRNNRIALCSNYDAEATLRHEAVHAAQDCKDGLDNNTLELLYPANNPFINDVPHDELSEWIMDAYSNKPQHWAYEYEAFVLMEMSNGEVARIVAETCERPQ
jgi:hypothetical protein